MTTPITMPDANMAVLRTLGRYGQNAGEGFNALLSAAMGQGGLVPSGAPLPSETLSSMTRAVMTALSQVQGGWPAAVNGLPQLGGRMGVNPLSGYQGMNRVSPPPAAVPAPEAQPRLRPVPASDRSGSYEAIIQRASQRYGVDDGLIRAVIQTESSFNPQAVSPVGAQGLMQLMPATAAELGVKDALDPEQNIMGGTLYLSRLLGRYQGDRRLALAAYNWGMGNLERHPEAMPTETRRYVAQVMNLSGSHPA